jgi:hypothetical protein
VRFTDFLRTTVLLCAASATVLALITVGAAANNGDDLAFVFAAGWWLGATLVGIWVGRRADASPPVASLLASARTQSSLPEVSPGRTLLNRLWPLLICTVGAAAAAFEWPQVSAVAAGFAMVWALSWRRQASAVAAIEDRDGARFYVERTSPLRPIKLVRTPGFRSNLLQFSAGSARSRGVQPRV